MHAWPACRVSSLLDAIMRVGPIAGRRTVHFSGMTSCFSPRLADNSSCTLSDKKHRLRRRDRQLTICVVSAFGRIQLSSNYVK